MAYGATLRLLLIAQRGTGELQELHPTRIRENKMKKIWLPVVMFIVGGLVGALIIHLVEQKKFEITRTQLLEATDAFVLYRHGYIRAMAALEDCLYMIPDACFRMTESIDDFATVKKRIDRYESEEHEIFIPNR